MSRVKHKSSKYLLRGTSLHKAKRAAPKTTRKKIEKEVHKAQKIPAEVIGNPLKKSSPHYKSKSYKPLPKKKWIEKSQKFSHDTAKEEILGTMNPQGIHSEGKRWIKTLNKQERLHFKESTHHDLKNRSPRKLYKK